MKIISLFIMASLSTSCSQMVSFDDNQRTSDGRYKGTVVYNPAGMAEIVNKRRNSALTKIEETCPKDEYIIIREVVDVPESREGLHRNSLATFGASELKFIDFECKY